MGPSAGTLGFPPPPLTYGFAAEPKIGETGEERQEKRERRGEGSAAQFVASKGLGFLFFFFFCFSFPPPPFFLCKKCRKAGQLFERSVMFPEGRGKEGPRPVNPVWD